MASLIEMVLAEGGLDQDLLIQQWFKQLLSRQRELSSLHRAIQGCQHLLRFDSKDGYAAMTNGNSR